MPPEKRNPYLDADDSEDDASQGYDSQADEPIKGGRGAKRRRVESLSEDEDEVPSDDEALDPKEKDEENLEERGDTRGAKGEIEQPEEVQAAGEQNNSAKIKSNQLPGESKPLTKKALDRSQAAVRKSGVIYISRIPPFMKPAKVRSLLSPYGAIGRIFLTPEDPAAHTRRVKNGGNRKRTMTDGWVEFVRKKDAKKAVALLNAQTIGGKKGTYYRDDIWNMLYLKGFKWKHLTHQIASENAERDSRMRAELGRTIKENEEFLMNVEKAKMLDRIQSKKAAKKRKLDDVEGDEPIGKVSQSQERTMTFKQIPIATKKENKEQPEQVQRVLSKIF